MSVGIDSDISELGDAPSTASFASGVRWNGVSSIGQQVLKFGTILILARLLGPKNYGVMTQAGIFVGFVALFLDQGLGSALVQKPRLQRSDIGTVFCFSVVSSLALAALTFVGAPFLADFFRMPELSAVLRVLALGVIFKGIGEVPLALLARQLRFRALAGLEISSLAAASIAGVLTALLGGRYWSLVVMTLVQDGLMLVGVITLTGKPVVAGSRKSFRAMRSFSGNLLGFEILNFGSRNADTLVVSRVLGAAPLAQYSLSYRTMMLPVQNLSWLVSRVAFPFYAKLQDTPELIGKHFLRTARLIAFVSFPAMMLVLVLAPTAVPFVFGPEWAPAVLPMQVLALTGARQSVHSLMGPVFMATGRTDWLFRFQLFSTGVSLAAFVIGVQWGITGVAVAYTAVGIGISPLEIALTGRLAKFGAKHYFEALGAALVSVTLAGVASEVLMRLLLKSGSQLLALAVTSVFGFVFFFLAVYLIAPRQIQDAREAFFVLIGRSRPDTEEAVTSCA